MNITFEEKENLLGEVKLELEPQDYLPSVQKKLKDVSKYAQMPGFRPGKVPTSLLQKMYGKSILIEEVNKIVNTQISDYLKNNNINVLLNYEIDETRSSIDAISHFNFNQPAILNFHFNLVLRPKLNIDLNALLSDTNFTLYEIKPTEEEIQEFITDVSYDHGTSENPQTVDLNDLLYGSLTSPENENFKKPMQLNLRKAPLSIAEKFVGKKADDTLEFDLETIKTLHKNYAARITDKDFLLQENAPKTLIYTIKNITRITPHELNEEFYNTVSIGKAMDKDTFYHFIQEKLARQYNFIAKNKLYDKVMDLLLEKISISLPLETIRERLSKNPESKFNTLTPEQQDKVLKDQLNILKERIIADEILQANHITITDTDIQRQSVVEMKIRISYMLNMPFVDFITLEEVDLEGNEEHLRIYELAKKILDKEEDQNKLYYEAESYYVQKILLEQVPFVRKEVTLTEYRQMD